MSVSVGEVERLASIVKTTFIDSERDDPVMGRTNSGRFTDLDADKLRGGYYTSSEVAAWLAAWSIRNPSDRILEPSCGDGAFLCAAVDRFASLGVSATHMLDQLTGVEIVASEAELARKRLASRIGLPATEMVETEDFFAWWQNHSSSAFDAVIGNPPFIRYQSFPEPFRSRAMAIMKQLGLKPNRLTNIWVPFVVAAATILRPSGRLALVLPAELLQVSYASQLRSFLCDRFTRVDIVACNELFFKNAEQEVILLLADGALAQPSVTNSCTVALTETKTVTEITSLDPADLLAYASPKIIHHDYEKWLKYFLTEREIKFMRELRASQIATVLCEHASVDIGVVTGKNEFFVLSANQALDLGISDFTVPLISKSMHLQGTVIGTAEWEKLSAGGSKVHLLYLASLAGVELPPSLKKYIRIGEANKVHEGYKCSIRTPWYVVPSFWIPDGFAFRQIHDFPRIVLNRSGATSTDTIHRLRCKEKPELVIASLYSYLTAASAEIEGRSYGGGVLELEPTEAENLLVPAKLGQGLPLDECDRLVRAGSLETVLEENNRLILINNMGLSQTDCTLLRDIWDKMRNRRHARRRRGRNSNSSEGQ